MRILGLNNSRKVVPSLKSAHPVLYELVCDFQITTRDSPPGIGPPSVLRYGYL
jgi:hypothetical protein